MAFYLKRFYLFVSQRSTKRSLVATLERHRLDFLNLIKFKEANRQNSAINRFILLLICKRITSLVYLSCTYFVVLPFAVNKDVYIINVIWRSLKVDSLKSRPGQN